MLQHVLASAFDALEELRAAEEVHALDQAPALHPLGLLCRGSWHVYSSRTFVGI